MEKEHKEFYERLEKKGVSRRDFMRYCTFLTATMGLSSSFVPKVAEVFAQPAQRPPVDLAAFRRVHRLLGSPVEVPVPVRGRPGAAKSFPWSIMKPSWRRPDIRPKKTFRRR